MQDPAISEIKSNIWYFCAVVVVSLFFYLHFKQNLLQPNRDNFSIDSHIVVFWLFSNSASLSSFIKGLKVRLSIMFYVFDDI